ncbi:MAG: peptide chain release factor N(5)-glutamine methyltransferase [Bacteroidia bacterium]|nr:peptide chain release factor N(5)-glutamine methyltransferase [Bacteroidia bacterium]MDW8235360.1 HemK/PrmC family methyltransferase [Bacteroidia bacterium]
MGSQPLTLRALRQWSLNQLTPIYSEAEAQAIVRRLLRHFMPDWEQQWLLSQGQAHFPSEHWHSWQQAITRLQQEEPLGYILGEVAFGELTLKVRPGVFIPRPETEEWTSWLIQRRQTQPPRSILDIGTGSGAIAIRLAYHFPEAQVYAIDKSPLALATTAANALLYGIRLTTAQVELGKERLPVTWPAEWELIVANPPYISWSYWGQTERRVRLYEPPEALFCRDKELYEVIANFALQSLSPTGECIVELFPPTASAVQVLWEGVGFSCEIYCDISGRPRWLRAVRKQRLAV